MKGILVLILIWMNFRQMPIFSKDRTLWWGILVWVLFSAEFILIYWGLEFTHASRAVIFINMAPFVVALGAR